MRSASAKVIKAKEGSTGWHRVVEDLAWARHSALLCTIGLAAHADRGQQLPAEKRRRLARVAVHLRETTLQLLRAITTHREIVQDHAAPHPTPRALSRSDSNLASVEAQLERVNSLLLGMRNTSRGSILTRSPLALSGRAQANLDSSKLLIAADLLLQLAETRQVMPRTTGRAGRKQDRLGVGQPYAGALESWLGRWHPTRIIATHSKPDADALTASWLARHYLFDGESAEIVFVARTFIAGAGSSFDCVVDVGSRYDPSRLLFDHNAKAVRDPCSTCASLQLWEHLRQLGHPVDHLRDLVTLVHDGDIFSRQHSAACKQSRRTGLHAQVRALKSLKASDAELCAAVHAWLSAAFAMR